MPTATGTTASGTADNRRRREPPPPSHRSSDDQRPRARPRPARLAGHGASVPPSGSSDTLVQAALTSGHDLTVPQIAQAAGLGKSTVAKALNRLAATGQASRSPASGSGITRTADRWNLAPGPAPAPAPHRHRH